MTDIDSIMSFVLLITILSFILIYSSNFFSSEVGLLRVSELRKSSNFLSTQLFQTFDNSLLDAAKKIQVLFKENLGVEHEETLQISIEPIVKKIHVYDKFLNEIPSSTQISANSVIVTFTLSFNPNEEKRIDIFYFGRQTENIDYLSDQTGISARILSDKEIFLVSQDRCNILNDYNKTRENIGFDQQFKIDLVDCVIGSNPPETNVIVSNFPILIEKSNDLISGESARVMVW